MQGSRITEELSQIRAHLAEEKQANERLKQQRGDWLVHMERTLQQSREALMARPVRVEHSVLTTPRAPPPPPLPPPPPPLPESHDPGNYPADAADFAVHHQHHHDKPRPHDLLSPPVPPEVSDSRDPAASPVLSPRGAVPVQERERQHVVARLFEPTSSPQRIVSPGGGGGGVGRGALPVAVPPLRPVVASPREVVYPLSPTGDSKRIPAARPTPSFMSPRMAQPTQSPVRIAKVERGGGGVKESKASPRRQASPCPVPRQPPQPVSPRYMDGVGVGDVSRAASEIPPPPVRRGVRKSGEGPRPEAVVPMPTPTPKPTPTPTPTPAQNQERERQMQRQCREVSPLAPSYPPMDVPSPSPSPPPTHTHKESRTISPSSPQKQRRTQSPTAPTTPGRAAASRAPLQLPCRPTEPSDVSRVAWETLLARSNGELTEAELTLMSLNTLKDLMKHYGINNPVECARIEVFWRLVHDPPRSKSGGKPAEQTPKGAGVKRGGGGGGGGSGSAPSRPLWQGTSKRAAKTPTAMTKAQRGMRQ